MYRIITALLTAALLSACGEVDADIEGAPAPEGPNVKRGVAGFKTAPETWWYDLSTYPYTPKYLAYWVQYQWRNQLNIKKTDSPSVTATASRAGATMYNWDEGNGWLISDFHGVEVHLPAGDARKTPRKLLELIRDNPAMVGGGPRITDFNKHVAWPSTLGGKSRQPGDVVFLDLWGPDNAAIVYVDTDVSDGQFCVITASHAQTGWHPVNGVRCWGYIEWAHNGYTHLFYTTGVDSTSVAGSGWVGRGMQFGVWGAQLATIARHVECMWGRSAGQTWQDDEVQEWMRKSPGTIGVNDVDQITSWDANNDATSEYDTACRESELLAAADISDSDEGLAFDDQGDDDADGVTNGADLCSGSPAEALVWADGDWAGCAAGQLRDV